MASLAPGKPTVSPLPPMLLALNESGGLIVVPDVAPETLLLVLPAGCSLRPLIGRHALEPNHVAEGFGCYDLSTLVDPRGTADPLLLKILRNRGRAALPVALVHESGHWTCNVKYPTHDFFVTLPTGVNLAANRGRPLPLSALERIVHEKDIV
jgi:hypothetical protein